MPPKSEQDRFYELQQAIASCKREIIKECEQKPNCDFFIAVRMHNLHVLMRDRIKVKDD